jgi:hypothetical protein
MTRTIETRVMMMTIGKAFVLTQPATSLHQRSVAEGATATTSTYVTSSAAEMHVAKFKGDAKIGSVKSKNSAMKRIVISMVLSMTNLTGSGHRKRDTSLEASRHIPET